MAAHADRARPDSLVPRAGLAVSILVSLLALTVFLFHDRLPVALGDRLWGLAHFGPLAAVGRIGIVLSFCPWLLWLRAAARAGEPAGAARLRPEVLYPLAAMAAGALCWTFRQRHAFLGDSYFLLSTVAQAIRAGGPIPVSFDEPLAMVVNGLAVRFGGAVGLSAETSLRLVSVAAGAFAFPFLLAAARAIAGKPDRVPRVFLVLAGAPWTGLFFGTMEHYAWAMAFLCAFLHLAHCATADGKGFRAASLSLGFAAACHLVALTALPAYALLAWVTARRGQRSSARVLAGGIVLLALPLALTHVLIRALPGTFDRLPESHLLALEAIPLLAGSEPYFRYRLLDPRHLTDVGSEVLLVAMPALLVLPLAASALRRALAAWEAFPWLLVLLSTSFALFAFLWNPGRGYYGDWDLFSFVGLGPVFLAAWGLSRVDVRRPEESVTLLMSLLLLWVHHAAWIMGNAVGYARLSVLSGG